VVLGEHLTYAFEDPQAVRFLSGVAGVCAGRGLGMTIVPAEPDRVLEAAVDAFVVWTTADDDPVIDAVAATGLPAAVHGGPERPGMGFVAADDRAAAAAVAAEAFAGARRPAVLSFPLDRARTPGLLMGPDPEQASFRVTRERLLGFRDAWERAGGAWADVRVVVCARNSAREAEERAAALIGGGRAAPDEERSNTAPPDEDRADAAPPDEDRAGAAAPEDAATAADEEHAGPIDAVAAMSDELALGALRAGLGDVPVTGWDDGDAAEAAGLTTIAQSLHDQGARCARLALGEPPAGEDLGWRLVRRGHRPSAHGRA
jgi:DNA-binding LacI/PurR family transcriptional regulator